MAKKAAAQKPERKREHHAHHGRELRTLEHVIEFLLDLEKKHMALDSKVTDALAAQDAKLADLSAKVDAFVASHQGQSAADAQAVVDALAAQGAAVDAIASKVTPTV